MARAADENRCAVRQGVSRPASKRILSDARRSLLLPNRKPATTKAWLSGRPQINIVARDRGGGSRSRQLRPCQVPSKSPTVGTSWRMPAVPFSTQCGNPCGKSAPRSAPQPSTLACSLLPSASNMKAIYIADWPSFDGCFDRPRQAAIIACAIGQHDVNLQIQLAGLLQLG
jgi:hypothetical protein